ncbi:MAG TPA: hypothetical protein VNV66_06630 [Pilimelia sp.]|nr:hypothetical protein [Pilimelia sp.]
MDTMPTSRRRGGRWLAALLLLTITAGLQVVTAAPAAAVPGNAMWRCQNDMADYLGWSAEISGTSRLVSAIGNLQPGSVIRITASGSVHNGSWFGQWRGPDGSLNDPAPHAEWPAIGVNKFALYGRWSRNGHTFHAGSDSGCLDYSSARSVGNGAEELGIGVNDDVLHDNSGSFRVNVRVWTNSSDVVDGGFERQSTSTLSSPWSGEGTGFKGVDVNRGLSYSGRNNAFIRTNTGWNAVTQRVRVVPNRMYRMSAWVRTSGNYTGGTFGVRPVGRSTPLAWGTYGDYSPPRYRQLLLDFHSGPHGELTLYVGYWAPGYDSWVQVDDVQVWAH